MARDHNDIAIKIEEDEDWRVFTSRNGNGFWAVGVGFKHVSDAISVAAAIAQAARGQGDRVTWKVEVIS